MADVSTGTGGSAGHGTERTVGGTDTGHVPGANSTSESSGAQGDTPSPWDIGSGDGSGSGDGPDGEVIPVVPPPTHALVVGSNHSCLLEDGRVRCWGWNYYGQLGDGSLNNRPAPVEVPGLSSVRALALGRSYTCAVLYDRSVACWGDNEYGQLGDGSTDNHASPRPVMGLGRCRPDRSHKPAHVRPPPRRPTTLLGGERRRLPR